MYSGRSKNSSPPRERPGGERHPPPRAIDLEAHVRVETERVPERSRYSLQAGRQPLQIADEEDREAKVGRDQHCPPPPSEQRLTIRCNR